MKIEILTHQDDSFRITGLASQAVEPPVEEPKVEEVPAEVYNHAPQPRPAPIENQRGLDWFNGTSWGNQ